MAAASDSDCIRIRGRYFGIAGPSPAADGDVRVSAHICGPLVLIHQTAADNGTNMNVFTHQFDVCISRNIAASTAAISVYKGFLVLSFISKTRCVSPVTLFSRSPPPKMYTGTSPYGTAALRTFFPFRCVDHSGFCQVKRVAVCKNKSRKRRPPFSGTVYCCLENPSVKSFTVRSPCRESQTSVVEPYPANFNTAFSSAPWIVIFASGVVSSPFLPCPTANTSPSLALAMAVSKSSTHFRQMCHRRLCRPPATHRSRLRNGRIRFLLRKRHGRRHCQRHAQRQQHRQTSFFISFTISFHKSVLL